MAVFRNVPYPAANFVVDLGTGTTGPAAAVAEVVLPEARVQVVEYRSGNDKDNSVHKVPSTTEYTELDSAPRSPRRTRHAVPLVESGAERRSDSRPEHRHPAAGRGAHGPCADVEVPARATRRSPILGPASDRAPTCSSSRWKLRSNG